LILDLRQKIKALRLNKAVAEALEAKAEKKEVKNLDLRQKIKVLR
jgi:hypothetical protein